MIFPLVPFAVHEPAAVAAPNEVTTVARFPLEDVTVYVPTRFV
jgi:hypothetical protein